MHHNTTKHILKDEQGNHVAVNGLASFAKEKGIGITYLSFLVNGHIKSYRGYTLASPVRKKKVKQVNKKKTKESELLKKALFA